MDTDTNSTPLKTLKVIAIILLILTTLLWGTSFIITKSLTKEIPIFFYLGLTHRPPCCYSKPPLSAFLINLPANLQEIQVKYLVIS